MRKNYKCLKNIKGLNMFDIFLIKMFKGYSYKIYSAGVKSGFNFRK